MSSKAFRFNSGAKYQPGHQKAAAHDVGDLAEGRVQVQYDDPQKWFGVQYPDICLLPPISSDKLVQAWRSTPMQFLQNQLNFAVWCATTGYGVSVEDHLSAADGFLRSFYRFHVYYQIRRILVEIKASPPQDQAWDAVNNSYHRWGYERICKEFGVPAHCYWKVSGPSWGLGRVYIHWEKHSGFYALGEEEYDPSDMSFTKKTTDDIRHVEYIKQDAAGADKAWKTFILNKSDGFTRPGVGRLNDSIRAYVWAILGAQSQTRTGILGAGAAVDAQKQFLANVEDAIASPVDIPTAIIRYQDVLQYARSEVNFSFGEGLFMAPGDMLLRVGKIAGYNNLIIIATEKQRLGANIGLNKDVAPPDASNDTGEKGLVKPMSAARPPEATTSQLDAASDIAIASDHEDEKTTLVRAVLP